MPRLRGEVRGLPLTEREHQFLYQRAMQGSRKDAAREVGVSRSTARNTMASIFAKLDVEDVTAAYWAMGWLRPLRYGVSEADVRDEKLREGEQIEREFWRRMTKHG